MFDITEYFGLDTMELVVSNISDNINEWITLFHQNYLMLLFDFYKLIVSTTPAVLLWGILHQLSGDGKHDTKFLKLWVTA